MLPHLSEMLQKRNLNNPLLITLFSKVYVKTLLCGRSSVSLIISFGTGSYNYKAKDLMLLKPKQRNDHEPLKFVFDHRGTVMSPSLRLVLSLL